MGKKDLDPELRERVMEFYDASLRYQDRKVAELFETLRESGAFDNTLIVVCSDHGKTLGGFDRSERPPHYLRDINTRVPLLVKSPGQEEGNVVDSPVELVSTHEHVLDGGSRPLGAYQPHPDHALFEDFIPHTGRQTPDDGVTYWRGLGTQDRKFVRSDTSESFLFEGQGDDERLVTDADAERKRRISGVLSERVDNLRKSSSDVAGGQMADLGSDVQAQLEDLGYM